MSEPSDHRISDRGHHRWHTGNDQRMACSSAPLTYLSNHSSHRAQSSLVSEFRRTQEEHRRRLDEMVERERRSLFVVAGIGLVVVVCLLIMLTK